MRLSRPRKCLPKRRRAAPRALGLRPTALGESPVDAMSGLLATVNALQRGRPHPLMSDGSVAPRQRRRWVVSTAQRSEFCYSRWGTMVPRRRPPPVPQCPKPAHGRRCSSCFGHAQAQSRQCLPTCGRLRQCLSTSAPRPPPDYQAVPHSALEGQPSGERQRAAKAIVAVDPASVPLASEQHHVVALRETGLSFVKPWRHQVHIASRPASAQGETATVLAS